MPLYPLVGKSLLSRWRDQVAFAYGLTGDQRTEVNGMALSSTGSDHDGHWPLSRRGHVGPVGPRDAEPEHGLRRPREKHRAVPFEMN